jgi:1-acyl-sn-glycerol-3-phosphate acyltransferase
MNTAHYGQVPLIGQIDLFYCGDRHGASRSGPHVRGLTRHAAARAGAIGIRRQAAYVGAVSVDAPKLQTPPAVRLRWGNRALRWYFAPEYLHLDRADPDRPTLFVGNHSVFGVLDVLLFADSLYRQRGITLRMLADRNHFKIPLWRDFVVQTGAVHGTRANCAALMRRGEHLLVFPGGAREVFKHKGEAYRLIWKERYGFVRLAIEHGYSITPYATVGAEEAFDVLLDSSDYMNTPVGRFLKRRGIADRYLRGGEEFPPVVRGLGLTMIPRPEKLYFSIGRPIETARYRDEARNPQRLRRVRDRVSRSLVQLIAELRALQARDTRPGRLRRMLNRL